jgi:signal transduction histidine kinase
VNETIAQLTDHYALALQDYLQGGGEATLLRAYELGRTALGLKLGVLEIATLHQEALVLALLEMLAPEDSQRTAKKAAEFFVEAVAPFEISRRGFQEANARFLEINIQLEERVRSAQEQLEEKKRMEQLKDEFISIASHELRTPLTSIHGSLGLIQAGVGGVEMPPKVLQLLDVARRNTERLVRLVNDMLDIQKIESGAMAFSLLPLEIAPLVEQAVEANQAYARDFGVTLAISGKLPAGWVMADSDRLIQVMTNLISNAVKFSPRGETVSVAAARANGVIRVSVSDHGPGIPNEFRGRIFQKFAQADSSVARRKGGTGLGLNITRAILERLSGRIDFADQEGTGTTFFFELPEWNDVPVAAAGRGGP